jgi:hypothetical protein
MTKLYGHKWSSSYGDKDDGNLWLATLGELSPADLMKGLRGCANNGHAWPPSAPEFKAMCLPSFEDHGLPSTQDAYKEAADKHRIPSSKKWSHAAVYHAGRDTGWFLLGTASEDKSFPKFKKNYESICNRVMNGETFNLPKSDVVMLENNKHGKRVTTEESKKAGSKALSELKGMF